MRIETTSLIFLLINPPQKEVTLASAFLNFFPALYECSPLENTDRIKAFLSVIRPYYCKNLQSHNWAEQKPPSLERNGTDNAAILEVKKSLKNLFYFRTEIQN